MARPIRTYDGGQVQARGLADVSRGPHATAESMGAGKARDLYNFGGAIGNVGSAMFEINRIKQKRIDETAVRDEMTSLNDQYNAWEKEQLSTRKGMAAANLDKDAEAWFKERRQEIESRLKGNRQADLFNPLFERTVAGTKNALSKYSFEQVAVGEKLSRDAQNKQFMRENQTKFLLSPEEQSENRKLIHANIRANLVGQSEDVIREAIRASDVDEVRGIIEAHAVVGPNQAVAYLDRDDVKAVLGPVEHKELRDKYANAAVNNGVNVLAMDLAKQTERGETTSAEVQELAYEKFPDDPSKPENTKLRQTMMNVYDNHLARLKTASLSRAMQAKQDLTDRLAAVNFDLNAMSAAEQKAVILDNELYQTVTRFQKWKNSEETNPDHFWVYQMEQMEPSELMAWLNEPRSDLRPESNFDIFLRKTAGKQELMNKVYSRANAKSSEESFGIARFDPTRYLQNVYGEKYTSREMIFWESPENFWNDDTAIAKFRLNGWLEMYNHNLAEKEQELKRKANFFEQEAVAHETWRIVKDRDIDLDKSFWLQKDNKTDATGGQAAEKSVDVATLPFEERRFNRGEPVVRLSPEMGVPEGKFGKIRPDDRRLLPPEIIDYKAKDVFRAYQAGKIGDQDYNADDFIIYGSHGDLVIFDGKTGKMKGEPMVKVLPANRAAEEQNRMEQAELERIGAKNDAEAVVNILRNRKVELEREYDNTFGSRLRADEEERKKGELIPRNNQLDMARLQYEKRMREIDGEIKKAEQELKRVSGGMQ